MTNLTATRLKLLLIASLLIVAIAAAAVGFNNPLYEP